MKSSWKKVKIGQLGRIVTGKTPKTSNSENYGGKIPFLTPTDDMLSKFVLETERALTEQGVDSVRNQLLPAGAVAVSCIGSQLGKVTITTRPTVTNQQINSIVVDETNFDSDFVYYAMLILGKRLRYIAGVSTAVPIVNKSSFSQYEVLAPDIEEQRKISSILSALDDKIAINKAINKNLEATAQAIFKSWFVDFEPFAEEQFLIAPNGLRIPQSLSIAQIKDLEHILESGKRPKGGAVAQGIPSIGAENVKKLGHVDLSSAKFIPADFAQSLKQGRINGYELLIYKDGGRPGEFMPHFSMFGEGFPYKDDFYINEHVFKLDFGNKGFNCFSYFYFLTDFVYKYLEICGCKAAVPGINKNNIENVWIYRPDNELVKKFCNIVEPIFANILKNSRQNQELAEIRDALLPKLMSGEIDVSQVKI